MVTDGCMAELLLKMYDFPSAVLKRSQMNGVGQI